MKEVKGGTFSGKSPKTKDVVQWNCEVRSALLTKLASKKYSEDEVPLRVSLMISWILNSRLAENLNLWKEVGESFPTRGIKFKEILMNLLKSEERTLGHCIHVLGRDRKHTE